MKKKVEDFHDELTKVITEAGVENCLFLVSCKPLHKFIGFISYTSSNDKEFIMPCFIDEKRYKVTDNYKVVLKPIHYPQFATEHYYISDLRSLIKSGIIKLFIQKKIEE